MEVIHACFLWQKSLYEICVATCDDWEDGHDLFPDKQFNMAGDRWVICFGNCTLVIEFHKTATVPFCNDFSCSNAKMSW